MRERRLAGILNHPGYCGGQQLRRYDMYVKIQHLLKYNPVYVAITKHKWRYTRSVGILYIDGKVHKNARDDNAGKRVKQRKISLFPWRK